MVLSEKQKQLIIHNYLSGTHPTSFSGINQLKSFYKNIKVKDLQNVLDSMENYTKFREEKKPRHYNPFFVRSKRHQVQADLMDVQNIAKFNDNYKYILTVIDIFTRYAWAVPLKSKSQNEVKNAFFNVVLPEMKTNPKEFASDEGKEFVNRDFVNELEKRNIKRIVLNNKAPHVERFNRTLHNLLQKYMNSRQGTERYIRMLPNLMRVYNERVHRIIKMSPAQAERDKNYENVLEHVEQYYKKAVGLKKTSKYKVGDVVRISSFKQIFHKHYRQTFKNTLYVIDKVLQKMPIPMYKLRFYDDGAPEVGSWYAEELSKVADPEKKVGSLRRSARGETRKNYQE